MTDEFLAALLRELDTCMRLSELGDSRPLQRWAQAVAYHLERGCVAAPTLPTGKL